MSRISEISRQYQRALESSHGKFEALYGERREATEDFYHQFLNRLICPFGDRFRNERVRERLQEAIERFTGTRELSFIAIDGTCQKQPMSEFITFFGGAYGAKGQIKLIAGNHKIEYRRWSLEHDVSMVAWVPVPFARLEEVTPGEGEQFLVTDDEKINLASVHTQIMQLAEIYLALNSIRSSRLEAPHILLMDLSPSSVMAAAAVRQDKVGLAGYPYDRRSLSAADITIAVAHPFSDPFGIPSPKKMDLNRVLVAALAGSPDQPLDLGALASHHGVVEDELKDSADFLARRGVLNRPRLGQPKFTPKVRVDESWAYVKDFFQNLCKRLFQDKDPEALLYMARDADGRERRRWMSPDDLNFLIGVGMRFLVEACWERKVLFYSIAKDSSSKYFSRNFFGVALETGFYPELGSLDVGQLPWTDRIVCEMLPLIDEKLEAPWSTTEFDSAFMTLHRELDPETNRTKVAGVMGRIVNQERLYARSLGQFFLKRDKATPLMGHVVFIERLLTPAWDKPGGPSPPAEMHIDTSELGKFSVYAWKDREQANIGQQVMMYLLSVLTRNHFAEAIGYPDPLHKADWGAKSLGRRAAEIIKSSTHYLAAKPLSKTFRSVRDAARR